MTTKRDRLRELEARVADLDRLVRHIDMVIAHIVEQHVPVSGQLVRYALVALTWRLTAAEDDAVLDFLKWAYDEEWLGRELTRERVVAEWERRTEPRIRGVLESVVKAWESEPDSRKTLSKILGLE